MVAALEARIKAKGVTRIKVFMLSMLLSLKMLGKRQHVRLHCERCLLNNRENGGCGSSACFPTSL